MPKDEIRAIRHAARGVLEICGDRAYAKCAMSGLTHGTSNPQVH